MEKTETGNHSPAERDDFDRHANRYEMYVPWEKRLGREVPFLVRRLREARARKVLDCACGPGRHAVALAAEDFDVSGIDASPEMVERARKHSREKGIEIDLFTGRLESLTETVSTLFDAVVCLGNSLSALDDFDTLETVIGQFARVLVPGGLLLTQTVDFSVVAPDSVNPSPLRRIVDGETEHYFIKSFVRVGEQVLIHWAILQKSNGQWSSDVSLRAINSIEPAFLRELVVRSGFSEIQLYGDYGESSYIPGTSRDVIVVARRD